MSIYLVFLAFLLDFSRVEKNIFLGEFWRRRTRKNYVCKTVGIFSIKNSIVFCFLSACILPFTYSVCI